MLSGLHLKLHFSAMSNFAETTRKFVTDEENFNTFAGVALIAAEVSLVAQKEFPVLAKVAGAISAISAGVMVGHVLPSQPKDYQPDYLPLAVGSVYL